MSNGGEADGCLDGFHQDDIKGSVEKEAWENGTSGCWRHRCRRKPPVKGGVCL